MQFKNWLLLKEDPDSVELGDQSLWWWDGLTFSLFDNYYVCSVAGYEVTHSDLMGEVSSCRDSILAGLDGSITPREVADCIGDSQVITTYGIPSRRAMELMLLIPQNKHASRIATTSQAPDIINGRIWIESKIISFWNSVSTLMKNKDKILEFVRMASRADERRFKYELTNMLVDYDRFVNGGFATKPVVFDPVKIHTMIPSPEKTQIMNNMGLMRSKPVDIRGRATREGD